MAWFSTSMVFAGQRKALGSGTHRLISEFEPTEAVVLSEDLFEADYRGPELIKAILSAQAQVWIAMDSYTNSTPILDMLRKSGLLEAELERVRFKQVAHTSLWLRDYGPLFFLSSTKGGGRKSHLELLDTEYRDPAGSANDLVPQRVGKDLALVVNPIPFELDGGNFLTAGDLCLTSHLAQMTPAPAGLKKILESMGCRELLDLEQSPHAHVDMWVKLVGVDQALVHEIDDRTLEAAKGYFGGVPPEIQRLREVLDEKAKELGLYLKVRRLPLPLPYRNVFRTYTNALLVNGTAILPSYSHFGWTKDAYPDQGLKEYYESKVARVYQESGFQPRWVEADALIFNGGAFRCASFQIPRIGLSTP